MADDLISWDTSQVLTPVRRSATSTPKPVIIPTSASMEVLQPLRVVHPTTPVGLSFSPAPPKEKSVDEGVASHVKQPNHPHVVEARGERVVVVDVALATSGELPLARVSPLKSQMPVAVATAIVASLGFDDAIRFGATCRDAYAAYNAPDAWHERFATMGRLLPIPALLPDSPIALSQAGGGLYSSLGETPETLRAIHRALYPYYRSLTTSNLTTFTDVKIFRDFSDPSDQARLLVNLQRYGQLLRDHEARARLDSILEIFENAILRELELHYDAEKRHNGSLATTEQSPLKSLAAVKLFAAILLDIGSEATLVDFFLQHSPLNDNPLFLAPHAYFVEGEDTFTLQPDAFHELFAKLAVAFNLQAAQIDAVFPLSVPMMYRWSEEVISSHVVEFITGVVGYAKPHPALTAALVPVLYDSLVSNFAQGLAPCANLKGALLLPLIDLYCQPFIVEYVNESYESFVADNSAALQQWEEERQVQEHTTETTILAQVADPNKASDKLDLLSSFKKIVIFGSKKQTTKQEEFPKEELTAFDAKIKILNEKLRSLSEIVSLELSMGIINASRILINRLTTFNRIASLKGFLNEVILKVYTELLQSIGFRHIGASFTKAIALLDAYDPTKLFAGAKVEEIRNIATVEPLVIFTELVNLADLIQQTLHIFYQENLVHSKIINPNQDFLNPIVGAKKKFELSLDSHVANGLNVGIDVLVHEIQFVFESFQLITDYHPVLTNKIVVPGSAASFFSFSTASSAEPVAQPSFGPTPCALKNVEILKNHVNLLHGLTDKAIIDVFQQEIGERFFAAIVKNLKHKCVVSTEGAITLIADLNYYYDFIMGLRQKSLVPLYTALKNVGLLYLIDGADAKTLGKMCSDLARFGGVFTQEDVYEFVQRRGDWAMIKRHVEKVMYGLTLGECVVA